jgi:hypothetical protein
MFHATASRKIGEFRWRSKWASSVKQNRHFMENGEDK